MKYKSSKMTFAFLRQLLIKHLYLILAFFVLVPTNAHALESKHSETEPLSLFGIGVHQELRNDIYIGAIFAPNDVKEISQLFNQKTPKEMSLRFIQNYSNRKVARLWKQRIAMNNAKTSWQSQTKNIVAFTKLFKMPMQPGDDISLSYTPKLGTKIYLNDSLFLTIKDTQFFSLLLNIWFGNTPPSIAFKTGISGNNTEYLQKKLITQFESLLPIKGRFDNYKPKKRIVKVKPLSQSTQKKKPKAKPRAKPRATQTTTNNKVAQKQSADSLTKQLVESFKPDIGKTVTAKEKTPININKDDLFKLDIIPKDTNLNGNTIKPIDLSIESSQVNQTKEIDADIVEKQDVIASKKKSVPIKTIDSSTINLDESKPVNTVDNSFENEIDTDLLSGTYKRELIKLVRQNQTYPKKAFQRGDEGDLVISVNIDRNGEIIESSIVKRSGSRYLDRGVIKQVRKLAPFPKIPDALNKETFKFEIPMRFSFSK